MDSASDATGAPPSSSAVSCGRLVGTVRAPTDDVMLSSFTSLNLRGSNPRGSTAGRDPTPASATAGVRPVFGLPGRGDAENRQSVAPTSSAGPRLASGRGRARTLPAWMTAAGETNGAVPGGLQGQPPVGGGAMVGVSQETAGRFSSRPSVGSGAVAGVPQATAGFYSSRLCVRTHTDPPSATNGEASGQQMEKKNITNKKKDGDVYSCKHYASNTGSFYGGAMDGRGRGPNGTSAMARQSSNESSQFDTAQTSHGQSPRPAPSASASVTGGPKPAASLPKNALPPAGRGVERTRPAWMTAGVTGVPGGLQDQASFGSGPAAARKSRPTGIYSSRPSPSAQSAPQAGQHSSFHESTDRSAIVSGRQDQPNRAGTFHVGKSDVHMGEAVASYPRRKGFSLARHAAGRQKTSANAGGHVQGTGIPARMLFTGEPAAAPDGFQQRAPAESNFEWVRGPAPSSFTSAPQRSAPFGQQAGPFTNVQAKGTKCANETKQSSAAENDAKQSEGSATAGAARSSGHEDKATVVDAQNPAPAPTAESDSAPNRATSGAGFAFQHLEDLEATGPEDWQLSGQLLGPKRGRDEGQSVERPASFVGMTGRIFKTGNAGPGPCVKKKKATVEKSSPPKDRMTARARYKIVHHDAIPKQGQKGVGATTSPASIIANDQYGTVKCKKSSASRSGYASLTSTSSSATDGEPANPPFVVIDGNNAGVYHQNEGGGWSARGPLLAIQYFEQRRVPCVAFLSRDRVAGVTLHDASYAEFRKAMANGTISEVPLKAKGSQYTLKHALDRKAHLVTNERHHPQGKTLAALGKTKDEVKAYLSRHHMSYTFARNEFVPDPRAPLAKMLTHQASSARRGKVLIAQH